MCVFNILLCGKTEYRGGVLFARGASSVTHRNASPPPKSKLLVFHSFEENIQSDSLKYMFSPNKRNTWGKKRLGEGV
jgi:hypothetical protein